MRDLKRVLQHRGTCYDAIISFKISPLGTLEDMSREQNQCRYVISAYEQTEANFTCM